MARRRGNRDRTTSFSGVAQIGRGDRSDHMPHRRQREPSWGAASLPHSILPLPLGCAGLLEGLTLSLHFRLVFLFLDLFLKGPRSHLKSNTSMNPLTRKKKNKTIHPKIHLRSGSYQTRGPRLMHWSLSPRLGSLG